MAGSIPASATRPQPPEAAAVVPPGRRARRRAGRRLRHGGSIAGLAILLGFVLVGVFAPALAPHDPFRPVGPALAEPSAAFPLGTDGLGRDLLSGIIHGTRTSLLVTFGVGAVAAFVGVAVGALAGYGSRRIDDALMRGTEIVQVVPQFFVAIVVIALWGPGLLKLVVVLGLTMWTIIARITRAEVLGLRGREFVESSRAAGASHVRLLVRLILPNALPPVIAYVGLVMSHALLLEASLGFLGLGDPSLISWGYLAGQAQRFLRVAWWLSVFPGIAIVLAALSLNVVGDALSRGLMMPWQRGAS